jgi:hypothetical protein
MSTTNPWTIEEPEMAPIAGRELTREGFQAYFEQMTTEGGFVETTPDWLADIAMLIVAEAQKNLRTAAQAVSLALPVKPVSRYCPACAVGVCDEMQALNAALNPE